MIMLSDSIKNRPNLGAFLGDETLAMIFEKGVKDSGISISCLQISEKFREKKKPSAMRA